MADIHQLPQSLGVITAHSFGRPERSVILGDNVPGTKADGLGEPLGL
jgi:hypothetical protein